MSPYQSRYRPDDQQPSRSPYQVSYRWMVKPFLSLLLFAAIGVLFSAYRSFWLGIPGGAESALYQQVINNPENASGCANQETHCRGITILKVYDIPFGMYETHRWCVVWGGNRWNSRTSTNEQFEQLAIIGESERGYTAFAYMGRCDGD